MQLNRFFQLEEFTRSDVAARYRIDNSPGPEILANLMVTALGCAQVRELVLRPIWITSGYRCPALNSHPLIRGSATSAHLTGQAADIAAEGLAAMGLAQAIRDSRIAFDQLILEGDRGIVHVGFGPRLRRQVLTQTGAAGTPFVAGLVS